LVIYFDTDSTEIKILSITNIENFNYDEIVYIINKDDSSDNEAGIIGNQISLGIFKYKGKC
jgi:hypothetical protein